MRKMNEFVKKNQILLFTLFVLSYLILPCGVTIQTAQDLATYCKTPTRLASWIKSHIWYKTDIEKFEKLDYWATSAETLSIKNKFRMRCGDCEDMAILTHDTLKYFDITSTIIGLNYKSGKTHINHIICIFNIEKRWCIIDSGYYRISNQTTLELALREIYKINNSLTVMEYNSSGKVISILINH
jgi:hypothetical protein